MSKIFHVCVFFIIFLYLVDENLRDEVEEYITTCRGKELPGFVNYRTFENIVKKHVQELEEPASQLLRDVIGKYQQLNQMLFFITVKCL